MFHLHSWSPAHSPVKLLFLWEGTYLSRDGERWGESWTRCGLWPQFPRRSAVWPVGGSFSEREVRVMVLPWLPRGVGGHHTRQSVLCCSLQSALLWEQFSLVRHGFLNQLPPLKCI